MLSTADLDRMVCPSSFPRGCEHLTRLRSESSRHIYLIRSEAGCYLHKVRYENLLCAWPLPAHVQCWSLQAGRIVQSLKKAEERLEHEHVLEVLKSSSKDNEGKWTRSESLSKFTHHIRARPQRNRGAQL